MKLGHIIHVVGGAIAVLAVYDLVAPKVSASLPVYVFPTSSNFTNLVVGGAIFALPLFF
jgi:hypothetical protein